LSDQLSDSDSPTSETVPASVDATAGSPQALETSEFSGRFEDLQLHPSLQVAIDQLGFESCTPIQTAVIPHILEGRDIAGLAQTGTGKTAAFLLPLMERMVRAMQPEAAQASEAEQKLRLSRYFPDWKPFHFILVLVPTRELAEQVYENAVKLAGTSGLRAVSIYGGVSYDKQKQALRDGVEIVVATPGRLIDLYKENLVDLKQVRAIVFDEADRMFDMGFKDDMKYILTRVPKTRQFLVFSATLNLDVLNTAYQFGASPVEFNVSRDQATAENVDDKIFHVGGDEKGQFLLSILRRHSPKQTIVFSNFKLNVPRVTQFLNDNGFPAVGISSMLTQAQRTRVMEQFKAESSDRNILVATDVAARGLDIKGVDLVVNFELPDDAENYVHRIGRTGRAGARGIAFSLVSDRDVEALSRIESYLKEKVPVDFLEEGEIVQDIKPMMTERSMARAGERAQRDAALGSGSPKGSHDETRRGSGGGRAGDRPRRDGGRGGEARGGGNGRGGESRSGGRGPSASRGPSPRVTNGNGSAPQGRAGVQAGVGPTVKPVGPTPKGSSAKNGAGASASGRAQPRGPLGPPIPVGQKRPSAAGPSLGQKVTGFIKRLFSR
jgi:ATP-dependent RNA helicase RhlB